MNAVYVYDLTYKSDNTSKDVLIKFFKQHCKKWCFQEEVGEGGFQHFQCRLSLGVKRRLSDTIKLLHSCDLKEGHLSITSEAAKGDNFYVLKPECRLSGPWADNDPEPPRIPRQIDGIELYEWQQSIADSADQWDTRHINIVLEETGNVGKSILCTWLGVHGKGRPIPPVNDYKDLMRMVMDLPESKLYLVDIPRALDVKKASQLYAALEEIKSGHAWDDRYSFKEKFFDCPNIWVFTNHMPPVEYLSADRWIIWNVVDKKLVKANINKKQKLNV